MVFLKSRAEKESVHCWTNWELKPSSLTAHIMYLPLFLYLQDLASSHCCRQPSHSCLKNHCNTLQDKTLPILRRKKKKRNQKPSYISSSVFTTSNSPSWFPFAAESRQPISVLSRAQINSSTKWRNKQGFPLARSEKQMKMTLRARVQPNTKGSVLSGVWLNNSGPIF